MPGTLRMCCCGNPEPREPVAVLRVVVPDGRHDEGLAAQHVERVGDVAGAAAELAAQLRDEERHVQDVYLVGQDVVLEAILEHHDVVVRDRAADQCAHGERDEGESGSVAEL